MSKEISNGLTESGNGSRTIKIGPVGFRVQQGLDDPMQDRTLRSVKANITDDVIKGDVIADMDELTSDAPV